MLTLRALPVILAGICAVVALVGPIVERRDAAAEEAVREYLAAAANGDAEAALAQLVPSEREVWRIFVEHQAGDQFHLVSLAVRRPSLLAGSGWRGAKSVTAVADIRGKGGEQWRDTTLVEGIILDQHWLLITPPFAPAEPWLVHPDA